METKHTPTPWEVGKTKLGDIAIYPSVAKEAVCILMEDDEANAAFIVRAVNEYDADKKLIEDLKCAAMNLLEAFSNRLARTGCSAGEERAIKELRQAIAKSEASI